MNCVVLISIGMLLKEAASTPGTASVEAADDSGGQKIDSNLDFGGNETDNDKFIQNFDEEGFKLACEWTEISDPSQLKLNLAREMNYEDATKLIFLNKGKGLNQTLLKFPDDIKWKRDLVNQIWSIYEASCPNVFVNWEYMNIMRELAMIYLNSVEPRESSDPEVWTAILESLVECGNKKFPPYNFTSAGLVIEKLIVTDTQTLEDNNDDTIPIETDGSSNGAVDTNKLMDIHIPMENAQLVFQYMDIIIDNLWQVFSHAFARCLRTAPSRELWGPRFKQLFFRDILGPLEERWTHPGERMRTFLDLIVGNHDVSRNQANIPYCTQAAYLHPSGTLLVSQLVRPIKLTEIERGASKFQNSRI